MKELLSNRLRRVFVWELPVRFFHWVNVLAIVALCITGYFIGNPPALASSTEPSHQYTFGTIRFIHFVAAYIFFFNFVFRLYWGFVGNKYADWKNFIPTTKRFFREMWDVIRIDILLQKNREHMAVGHNALAGFIYFLTFIAFLVQCITGFALYADMSTWWFADLWVPVAELFGENFNLRNWHHAAMWFFIIFAIIHVYLVFFHDYVEGRGELSSMAGGWKFIEEDAWEETLEKEEAFDRARRIKEIKKEHEEAEKE
jgi:Ni/Fe-hydrogenase 1 B-type cytochrome subunit